MTTCPGEAILKRLGDDSLDAALVAAIERHVEDCARCATVLERLAHPRGGPRAADRAAGPSPRIPGFRIQRELGRGGMSVVYLAIEEGLDRPVALKVLPGPIDDDGSDSDDGNGLDVRRRWLREARAVASVRHPNVVPLYDYGEADGWLYLVLEFVPGGTLKRRLNGPLPARTAAELLETIARAVGRIHDRGLLHLDLKPSNILLDGATDENWERAVPRVSDFGLAVGGDGLSDASLNGVRGTPAYMAPEQVDASPDGLGPATDVHALGAVLYQMLTGRPPFLGATVLETLDQVRQQAPVPPRRLSPGTPRDLETIALKCLEKIPTRRYRSAEELANDLRRWLDGRPIEARPVSAPERAWRWCRRRPAVAGLAASLALALACGFLGLFLLWRHAESENQRAERERARAESERRGAEADFQTAIDLLGQFVDPILPSKTSEIITRRDRIATLERTRASLNSLADRRPDRWVVSRKLARVDRVLGHALLEEKRLAEARICFQEALGRGDEVLRRAAKDRTALRDQIHTLEGFAMLAEAEGRPEEAEGHLRCAIELGDAPSRARARADVDGDTAILLAEIRHELAWLLARQGDQRRALAMMETNRRLLATTTTANPKGLQDAAWRLGARFDLDSDLLSRLIAPDAERLAAKDWAGRAARALDATAHPGLGPVERSEAGLQLMDFLFSSAAGHRRHGRFEATERIADRMLEFARLLVARYPDQPSAHLALSKAHAQFYKIAYQEDDWNAVERHMRSALDAAVRARDLGPDNLKAQAEAGELQKRLDELVHPR